MAPRIGVSMRERRIAQGLSLQSIAKPIGITRQYWDYLEKGQRQVPDLKHLNSIGKMLGVPPDGALAARVLKETTFWNLTMPQQDSIGINIMKNVLPHLDPQFANNIALQNHYDPNSVEVSDPALWPRPMLVDALCISVDTIHISDANVEYTLTAGKTVVTNMVTGEDRQTKPVSVEQAQFDDFRRARAEATTNNHEPEETLESANIDI